MHGSMNVKNIGHSIWRAKYSIVAGDITSL